MTSRTTRGFARIAAACVLVALGAGPAERTAAAAPPRAIAKKKTDKKSTKKKPAAHVTAAPKRAPAAPPKPAEIHLDVRRATLDNGLRVVLNPSHASPTVALAVTYDVGSRDDEPGRTGFAHLFEHMMFEGSKNVEKGEHMKLVSAHGGTLNATTDVDRTNYYEVLPANELALALWLEADRMKGLDVTEANFENQRKVVEEEYRMRYSNVPYRLSTLKLDELVYEGYWPYSHSTIGLMRDLDDAKIDAVAAFHAHHYGPNTAVVSLSGDFDPDEALALVKKYFGGVPKIEAAPFVDAKLPEQTSQRVLVVRDEHARSPMVQYGWAVPPNRTPDHYALEIAALVLADGESSRLHQILVRDKAVAQGVWAGTRDRRGPDLFSIGVKLSDGATTADVEKLVEAEVKALGTTKPPTDAELAKARRQVESSFVFGLQSNFSRATDLGEMELFYGDATLLNGELPRYFAVSKDDVKRVVAQYLAPTRRTIVETAPPARPDAAPPPKKKKTPSAPAATKKAADKKAADKKAPKKKGKSC
ncbi:MAG TPA: pitrilysin family protein, partial [Minicystis sp.]|nr:pitrilysin family protein [Minicystis sp.]